MITELSTVMLEISSCVVYWSPLCFVFLFYLFISTIALLALALIQGQDLHYEGQCQGQDLVI